MTLNIYLVVVEGGKLFHIASTERGNKSHLWDIMLKATQIEM